MDAFVRKHMSFILSTLWLVFGLLVLGYSTLYTRDAAFTQHVRAAAKIYKDEQKDLGKRIQNLEKSEEKEEIGIRSLPAFLARINSIARDTKVIIRELTPDEEHKLVFHMTIIEDYFDFLKFSSLLETLNVSIHNIEVHPFDTNKTPPLHAISFSLTPRNDAEVLSGARIKELQAQVEEKDKRNPFQRFVKLGEEIRAEVDLTWVYKLTGIGRFGDTRFATVNGKDLTPGEVIDKMTVKRVAKDRVYLEKETAEGVEKYVLGFRRKKKTGRN